MNNKNKVLKVPRKPVILIVDNVPKNIQVLGTLLNKLDCKLAVAKNGQQALDTVAQIMPDLILLDVRMPVLDGHEVCRRLKSSDKTKDIHFIFLTTKAETEDIISGFKVGANDYITKPFIWSELLARVKTHLSLKKAKEDLKEKVATKNKFFSIISHDLHSSFSVILNFVEILQENRESLSSEKTKELMPDIDTTTSNTLYLLDNLLEWARAQTDRIKFMPAEIDIAEFVGEAEKPNGETAAQKNIELKSEIKSKGKIYADKNMVSLILRNLVSNAIKFTPKGGIIFISAKKQEDYLNISVNDTGVGIHPEKITRLFHVDSKISTQGTENEMGNELGLIFCKEFVNINKGEIGIDRRPGKVTTAWFTLPKAAKN